MVVLKEPVVLKELVALKELVVLKELWLLLKYCDIFRFSPLRRLLRVKCWLAWVCEGNCLKLRKSGVDNIALRLADNIPTTEIVTQTHEGHLSQNYELTPVYRSHLLITLLFHAFSLIYYEQ